VTAAHASGAVNVVVTNPGGQSATSTSGYTYATAPAQAPTVTGVNPTSGPTTGGTSINITGTGFASGATVTVGGTLASSVVVSNSTTITAVTPAHTAGTVDVVVTNSDGQSGRKTSAFTYTSGETILLSDDFNDASLNTTKWLPNSLFSGFTDSTVALTETTTFAIGPLKQNVDGSHYNGIRSQAAFDFTGGYAYVEIMQGPNPLTAGDAFYTIGQNVDNCYRMYLESGNLILQKKIGGVKTTLLTTTFNATNHAFWRIRHDLISGQVVFETAVSNSGTPGAWTQLYAEAWNTSAVPLSSVLFELKAGTWRIEGANPGTVIFDNFKAAKP